MRFPLKAQPETPSRSEPKFRDGLSAEGPIRKLHPVLSIKSGTLFPSSTPSGKRIPLCTGIPRWTFRQGLQPESLSRNPRPKWDALSLQIACGRRIPEFAEERHMLSRLAYQTAPEHTLRQQQRKKGARANADALV